jgi:hypothetical protein
MFARGGYLPSIDHHIPPDVSLEAFGYYVDRCRELYMTWSADILSA